MKTLDVNGLMAVVNLPLAAGQLGSGGQQSCQNSAAVWAEIAPEVQADRGRPAGCKLQLAPEIFLFFFFLRVKGLEPGCSTH